MSSLTPPKPMLVSEGISTTPAELADLPAHYNRQGNAHWLWQPKYDGKRCLLNVRYNDINVAFSRSGKPIKLTEAQRNWPAPTQLSSIWLDGEIFRDGRIVIFDMVRPDLFFKDRLSMLQDYWWDDDIRFASTRETPEGYEPVANSEMPLDGVIARDPYGKYEIGHRSTRVVKHKFTMISRCYVVSWEEGKSRHHGALNLAMSDGGNVRYVGKVGTGISDEEFKLLISSKNFPVVEIRHLGFTLGGKLREPVYVRRVG